MSDNTPTTVNHDWPEAAESGRSDWRTEITVAAVIEDGGRFLVVEEEVSDRLVFNQPAGHLEEHETLVEAVIREAFEETGWHFQPQAISGIYVWKSPRRGTTIMRTAFCGTAADHDPQAQLDEGIRQAVWMTRQELEASQRLRSPFVLQCIDDYLRGTRHPLELVQHLGV